MQVIHSDWILDDIGILASILGEMYTPTKGDAAETLETSLCLGHKEGTSCSHIQSMNLGNVQKGEILSFSHPQKNQLAPSLSPLTMPYKQSSRMTSLSCGSAPKRRIK